MAVHTSDRLEVVIDTSLARLAALSERANGRFPNYGENHAYVLKDNVNWLAGFWTGLLWLAASQSKNSRFHTTASGLLPTFVDRLDQQIHMTHDLGFLYSLSARAQWQLTGDPAARDLALRAADLLLGRYRAPGGYIQAWGQVGSPEEGGRIIADTMMNLPLLFWASAQTGEAQYREAALSHARLSLKHLVRTDGSSHHTFFFNQETGKPLYAATHQGYSDDSWWARGHAWMIYGAALAAEWSGEADILDAGCRLAETFYAALPADRIPPWDLRLPEGAPTYRDSSASAIATCGLLRLAALTGDASLQQQASELLGGLLDLCWEQDDAGEGLLKHGALHIPKGWAPDAYLIFGDYFFLEAVLTITESAPDFWGVGESD